MPLKDILRDVDEERGEHPAHISTVLPSGEILRVPVKIRTRGHFRRDPVNCDFPPLRINFDRDSTVGTIFEGLNKIKLVTHCRSRNDKYNQMVLKEYLAYKMYNVFTDESYRVRLLDVTYVDTEGKKDDLTRAGFFIEPTNVLAERTGGEIFSLKNIRQDYCNLTKTNRMAVFQYMIGNTDWSVPAGHNIELLRYDQMDPPVTVPYDFDWCGMVDAPYAVPNEILAIDDVTTRLFRGTCRTEQEFQETFESFRTNEEEIMRLISSMHGLESKEKERTERFISQFYRVINNPNFIKNEFLNNCLTR